MTGRSCWLFGQWQGTRARTVVVAIAASRLLVACSDPDQPTDLRPAGPPEVLAVLVSDDTTGAGVDERATFCKQNDDKRPELIPANPNGPYQVCPEDLSQAADEADDTVPVGWYVRIQFDELLNPDRAESLVPILDSNGNPTGSERGTLVDTMPVTLMCAGITIPYDGYYNPSGNSLTWPVGPSLYVTPDDASKIATGSECQISIVASGLVDKDGNPVPTAQLGPYAFKIAPLQLVSTSPPAEDPTLSPPATPITIDGGSPLVVDFNAPVDAASLTASEVTVVDVASCDAATGTAHPAVIAPADMDPQAITIGDGDATGGMAWQPGKLYRISTNPGADIQDVAGGIGSLDGDAGFTVCFQTST